METWLKNKLRGDWQIWFIIMLLSVFSMMVVYSASSALAYKKARGNTESYLLTHTGHLLLGLFVIWVIHRIDYTKYAGISKLLLWITPFLLLYTYLFGTTVGGTKRWISLFGISFQSSDFVRLVLITNLAAMLARRQNVEYTQKTLTGLIFSAFFCIGEASRSQSWQRCINCQQPPMKFPFCTFFLLFFSKFKRTKSMQLSRRMFSIFPHLLSVLISLSSARASPTICAVW
jgi:hypothetical protein